MGSRIKGLLLGTAFVASTHAMLAASVMTQPEGHLGFLGERGGHPLALLHELDLTEDQREQLRALAEQGMPSGAFERVMERRKTLEEAIENGADEGTLRQLAYECGMAEGDAAVERSRMHWQMMEILTEEQREEYEARREEWRKELEERMKRFEERRRNRRKQPPAPSEMAANVDAVASPATLPDGGTVIPDPLGRT
jgi:Spy/CpxP family protein refolding chaperone